MEDMLKGVCFPGASDAARPCTQGFDIEAQYNLPQGIPVSIKTAKRTARGAVVCMADARRLWEINEPWLLLVATWRQDGSYKQFETVHEIIITCDTMDVLRGGVSLAEVRAFHEGISMARFPHGHHAQARDFAKTAKAELAPRCGLLSLNPKIDSQSQRRLQCSLHLEGLVDLVNQAQAILPSGRFPAHVMHCDSIGSLVLPTTIQSSPRFAAPPPTTEASPAPSSVARASPARTAAP